jgi:hypothetical protein
MRTDAKTFAGACHIEARISTNVPQGGDAGHGGKTTITLVSDGCAFQDNATQIEFAVFGDSEAEVLAESLEWAGERLRQMIAPGP